MNRLLRHIASFVLLASYLPMTVLSSLHVHHDTVDAQDDCLQCVGHIDTAHHHDNDCFFCIFLGLNYLVQDEGLPASVLPSTEHIAMPETTMAPQFRYGVAQLRAPPAA